MLPSTYKQQAQSRDPQFPTNISYKLLLRQSYCAFAQLVVIAVSLLFVIRAQFAMYIRTTTTTTTTRVCVKYTKPNIAIAEAKDRRGFAIFSVTTGTSRGASERILKTVYQETCAVQRHVDYGSVAWSTNVKTNVQTLERGLNQAFRPVTDAMRSTLIREVKKLSPFSERRDTRHLMLVEKLSHVPKLPMRQRLKWLHKEPHEEGLVHESKAVPTTLWNPAEGNHFTVSSPLPEPWAIERLDIQEYVTKGDGQGNAVCCVLTLTMIK